MWDAKFADGIEWWCRHRPTIVKVTKPPVLGPQFAYFVNLNILPKMNGVVRRPSWYNASCRQYSKMVAHYRGLPVGWNNHTHQSLFERL